MRRIEAGSSLALHLAAVPPDLWRRARRARHRLLLLDYDGTLAPFRVDRMRARPLAGSALWLGKIARAGNGTTVGIVSGRPVAELAELLGEWRGWLVGEHGWEIRDAAGAESRLALEPCVEAALAEAAAAAERLRSEARLECKRTSVVAHTRGLPEATAETVEGRIAGTWQELARRGGLRLEHVDGGLELRAATHDRGTGIGALLAEQPAGTFVTYLGDDASDEDAFRFVAPFGIGLRVGARSRPSLAQGRLADPEAVSQFLAAWWLWVEAGFGLLQG